MDPTPDQVARVLKHVHYEIESLLLTPQYEQWNKALEESVYFRKMAHCRVLYGFFTVAASQRKNDDVVSEDFGFAAEPLYVGDPKPLLARFNKDLFHLSYARLERTAITKPWPMETLFTPVCKRSKEFIEHVLTQRHLVMSDTERCLWAALKDSTTRQLPLQQNTSNVAERQTTTLNF